jgi:WD40 repeat protein
MSRKLRNIGLPIVLTVACTIGLAYWHGAARRPLFTAPATTFHLSPDGKKLFCAHYTSEPYTFWFRVYDLESGREILADYPSEEEHHGFPEQPSFSKDGAKLAVLAHPDVIIEYDLSTGERLAKHAHPGPIDSWDDAFYDDEGRLIARSVRSLVDVATGAKVGQVAAPEDISTESPRGPVSVYSDHKGVVTMVDMRRDQRVIMTMPISMDNDPAFDVTASTRFVGYAVDNGAFFRIVDTASGAARQVRYPPNSGHAVIHPAGAMLACAVDGDLCAVAAFLRRRVFGECDRDISICGESIALIDMDSQSEVARVPGAATKYAFSDDGSKLATHDDAKRVVMVWSLPRRGHPSPLLLFVPSIILAAVFLAPILVRAVKSHLIG